MNGNQAQMIAEAIRQGQAETERRLVMMKAAQGDFDGVNPLIAHFRDDPEIGRLQVDKELLVSLYDTKCKYSPFTFCPCLWPHSLILGMPCNYLYNRSKIKDVADAHVLTLHQRSLKLKVGSYPQLLQNAASQQALMVPWCFNCCFADTSPIEEVIPLTDVESVKIEKCQLKQCGTPIAPDTFTVRAKGYLQRFPLFAVDSPNPEQGQIFIRQIMDQVAKAKETAMHEPPLPSQWNEYAQSLYGGGMGAMFNMMGGMAMGGIAMGGPMGGAPGQMQMNRGGLMAAGMQQNQMMQMGSVMATAQPVASAEPVASAPADNTASELARIDDLKKAGHITEEEYQQMRKKALGL